MEKGIGCRVRVLVVVSTSTLLSFVLLKLVLLSCCPIDSTHHHPPPSLSPQESCQCIILFCQHRHSKQAMTNFYQPTLLLLVGLFCPLWLPSAHASWLDPDTPEYFKSTRSQYSVDRREYELVGSKTGRTVPSQIWRDSTVLCVLRSSHVGILR